MGQPTLSRDARFLIVVAGSFLERRIEDLARAIAAARSAAEITPDDVEQATAELFREQLSDLPRLVQHAMNDYRRDSCKAA